MAENGNNIELFKKYTERLDRVYKAAAKTSVLDSPDALVSLTNANEFKVPKMDMDGLADYDRKSGYKVGTVTLDFETKKPDYDRARKFRVEEMDNEESAGIAFGSLAAEFIRTKVVPEIDAYRFAKLASKGTVDTTEAATGAAILALLNASNAAMSEKEVPEEGRMLFITPTYYSLANSVDTNKDKAVLDTFTSIIQVPQTRFYTKISLSDGSTTGQEKGGFAKHVKPSGSTDGEDGKDINFLIAEKSAIMQYTKHSVNKAIPPDDNPKADAWIFNFREYGLADAYENKTAGIYVHHKA